MLVTSVNFLLLFKCYFCTCFYVHLKFFMNEFDLSYVTITYAEPIVYFRYKKGRTELGFPEIRELIAAAEKLTGHQPYFTLSDVRHVDINVTTEGKRVLSDMKNMPLFRGTAAVVKNNMYKFAIDFLNAFNKPKYPFRAFVNEEDAVAWLKSLPLE